MIIALPSLVFEKKGAAPPPPGAVEPLHRKSHGEIRSQAPVNKLRQQEGALAFLRTHSSVAHAVARTTRLRHARSIAALTKGGLPSMPSCTSLTAARITRAMADASQQACHMHQPCSPIHPYRPGHRRYLTEGKQAKGSLDPLTHIARPAVGAWGMRCVSERFVWRDAGEFRCVGVSCVLSHIRSEAPRSLTLLLVVHTRTPNVL